MPPEAMLSTAGAASASAATTGAMAAVAVGAPAASGARPAGRRTRPGLLAAVTAAVDAMCGDEERGPVSLLVTRLAERGVHVTEATLRSGDCRAQLARVWVRRRSSVRSFGPTGGHDLRPVGELVEHVIDLKWRIGRVRADMRGEPFDRAAPLERDRRSLAACARHGGDVGRRAALIATLLPKMAAAGVFPDFATVSEALGRAGEPLTARTIRRNEAYWRPIKTFLGIDPPISVADPERARLWRKSSEELGAMVYALLAELAEAEHDFLATFECGEGELLPD